ncbi:DMT family transporter [Variovorax sp. VNK109]|jgi:drug/metabolite transporter (DMT)-like permease|uniref:DMT family transporter n=1 Tax=Variovorax sp. VNK109 TaxID=3400919 RepID=UPI003C00AE03
MSVLSQRAANRRGITAMLISIAFFVVNDAIVKYLGQTLGGGQTIFLRGVCAVLMLVFVARVFGLARDFSGLKDRKVIMRSVVEACASTAYLTALFHMPLANATAINMATPLVITLFAVLFLKEHVAPTRWLAVFGGFAGVLLIVQPAAASFNAYSVLCVGAMLLYATRDFITRFITSGVPTIVVAIASAIGLTLFSGGVALFQEWKPLTLQHVGLLAAAGACVSGAFYMLIVSLRAGEMSVIAPFRYAALLFALVLGYFIWGDIPNTMAWIGIALLVAAGIYLLHSERARRSDAVLETATD